MARKILTEEQKQTKRLEKKVEVLFYKHANNVPINIMNLGKISKAGVEAGRASDGKDEAAMEAAVKNAIEQYREKTPA